MECKASRSDFLRDRRDRDALLNRRTAIEVELRQLEEQILKSSDPHARRPHDNLFADLAAWDYSACRNTSYRNLTRELLLIHQAIYGQTKFGMLVRYAQADHLMLAAPIGLLEPRELPRGWGLLEFSAEPCANEARPPIRIARGDDHPASARTRLKLLRNIAATASRAVAHVD